MAITSWESEVLKRLDTVSSSVSGGGGTTTTAINWATPTQGTIGTTAADILSADTNRKALLFKPNGKTWLNIGADASSSFSLFELNPGDTLYLDTGVTQRISAIAESANTTYTLRVAT